MSEEVVAYLAWPGLAQVARVERRRWIRGRESVELAYLITSLPADEAAPEQLLQLIRDHWAIENRLHYVRDVTFLEDRCRTELPGTREVFGGRVRCHRAEELRGRLTGARAGAIDE